MDLMELVHQLAAENELTVRRRFEDAAVALRDWLRSQNGSDCPASTEARLLDEVIQVSRRASSVLETANADAVVIPDRATEETDDVVSA